MDRKSGEGRSRGRNGWGPMLHRTHSDEPFPIEWATPAPPDAAEAACALSDRLAHDRATPDGHDLVQQAQKMEAIGQLAAGVAHDFNNLVQVILGHSEMVLDDAGALSPDDQNSLEEIRRAAQRAGELTRQLLAFSRRQALEMTSVDINSLVNDLAGMLRRLIGEHIALHVQLDRDPPRAHADAAQLSQVIINLAVNARDAMADGGRLTIRTGRTAISAAAAAATSWAHPGEFVVLEVSDTGPGISETIAHRIFEPFFTTKEANRGTGLGLSSVLGIVKQHGGLIEVANLPAGGACFRVYLPPSAAHKRQNDGAANNDAPTGSEFILVAEDDDAVRRYMVSVLESAGYRVCAAANGAQAVRMFAAQADHIDLVILDVIMPEMNGWKASEHIHEIRAAVPVVFCTGYSPEALPHGSDRMRRTRIIQKPCDRITLLALVRQSLDTPAAA